MAEFIFLLIVFPTFFLMWAALGHAFWLLLAKLHRLFIGSDAQTPPYHPGTKAESQLGLIQALVQKWSLQGQIDQTAYDEMRSILPQLPAPPAATRKPTLSPEPSLKPGSAPPVLAEYAEPLHPLDRDYSDDAKPAEHVVATQTRRAFADMLQSFMEEKNIRWGELFSAILIIGSAIGLIVSLREQLASRIPLFPTVLFSMVVAGVHAVGEYSLRHWRLPSTSRGILLIGSLLIPLTVLSAVLLADPRQGELSLTDPQFLVRMGMAAVVLGTLSFVSGRRLLEQSIGWWILSVMASTLVIGIMNRVPLGERITWWQGGLIGIVSLASLFAAVMRSSVLPQFTARWPRLESYAAQYRLLAVACFASLVALILWAIRTPVGGENWPHAALPVMALSGLCGAAGFGLFASSGSFSGSSSQLTPSETDAVPSVERSSASEGEHWLPVISSALRVFGVVGLLLVPWLVLTEPLSAVAATMLLSGITLGLLAWIYRATEFLGAACLMAGSCSAIGFALLAGVIPDQPLSFVTLRDLFDHVGIGIHHLLWGMGLWLAPRILSHWERSEASPFGLWIQQAFQLSDGEHDQSHTDWNSLIRNLTPPAASQLVGGLFFLLGLAQAVYILWTGDNSLHVGCAAATVLLFFTACLGVGTTDRSAGWVSIGTVVLIVSAAAWLRPDFPLTKLVGIDQWDWGWRAATVALGFAFAAGAAAETIQWWSLRRSLAPSSPPLTTPLLYSAQASAFASLIRFLLIDDPSLLPAQGIGMLFAGGCAFLLQRHHSLARLRPSGIAVTAVGFSLLCSHWLAPELASRGLTFWPGIIGLTTVFAVLGCVASALPPRGENLRSTDDRSSPWRTIQADVCLLLLFGYVLLAWMHQGMPTYRNPLFTNGEWLTWVAVAVCGTLAVLTWFRYREPYELILVAGVLTTTGCAFASIHLLQTTSLGHAIIYSLMSPLFAIMPFIAAQRLTDGRLPPSNNLWGGRLEFLGGRFESISESVVLASTLVLLLGWTILGYAVPLQEIADVWLAGRPLIWLMVATLTMIWTAAPRWETVASIRAYVATLLVMAAIPLALGHAQLIRDPVTLKYLLIVAVSLHTFLTAALFRSVGNWTETNDHLQMALWRFHAAIMIAVLAASVPLAILEVDGPRLRLLTASGLLVAGAAALRSSFDATGFHRTLSRWVSQAGLCWSLVIFAWSTIPADSEIVWPLRYVRGLITILGFCLALGLLIPRLPAAAQPWISDLRTGWLGLLALSSGLSFGSLLWLVAAGNVDQLIRGGLGSDARVLLIAQLALAAWLVYIVAREQADPCQSPAWQRMSYVYIAEGLIALSIAQRYLVWPMWFDAWLHDHWPFLLLGTAVASTGIGRLVERAGADVVGKPLQNTGLFLPVVGATTLAIFPSVAPVDVVLVLSAAFYMIAGAAEGSRRMSILGGVFANFALWCFYRRFDQIHFADHPQLWLIPPAVSVLIATYLERDRLGEQAAGWIRYLAMSVIFLSSSSEILIAGLGKSLWPPMVLAALSVGTALLGIVLRTRAYLFYGAAFLLVSVTAMVAHAQQRLDHTWPWWAFGITLGTAILALFGWFERNRSQMHELVERLRSWQA